jgi:hypothetical protein
VEWNAVVRVQGRNAHFIIMTGVNRAAVILLTDVSTTVTIEERTARFIVVITVIIPTVTMSTVTAEGRRARFSVIISLSATSTAATTVGRIAYFSVITPAIRAGVISLNAVDMVAMCEGLTAPAIIINAVIRADVFHLLSGRL